MASGEDWGGGRACSRGTDARGSVPIEETVAISSCQLLRWLLDVWESSGSTDVG